MTTKSLSVVCVVSHTFLLNDYVDPRHRFHSRRGGGIILLAVFIFVVLFSNILQKDCPPICQFGSRWFLKSRFEQTNNRAQYLQRISFLNWGHVDDALQTIGLLYWRRHGKHSQCVYIGGGNRQPYRWLLYARNFTASHLYLFIEAIGLSGLRMHASRTQQCRYFVYLAPIKS